MKRNVLTVLPLLSIVMALGSAVPALCIAAASATPQPVPVDDYRAAFATPQDIVEGKRVALASCAACHGLNGLGKSKGVPNIAGQRPVYLYMELRVYQAGTRGDTPMNQVVKFLSDDALVKVAAYYASLEPASPAAAASVKMATTKADPVSVGKAVAAGCSGCHGESGNSKIPGMPNLVGLDSKYLAGTLAAYKNGQRKHDMMKTLVAALSDADMSNTALYFAMQKPAKAQNPAQGNQSVGKAAATACAGCHGEGGVSINASTPSLAGQDAQYFFSAIHAYKDGARADASMKAPAASLDDAMIKDLAAYYASLPPQAPNVRKPLALVDITERCDRCHGVDGNSTDPRSPALAAQRADYLESVLHAYKKGERRSKAMSAMLDGVSDEDMGNLAAHYARQKARAVIYVTLPARPEAK